MIFQAYNLIAWFNNVYCVFLIMSRTYTRIGNGSPLAEVERRWNGKVEKKLRETHMGYSDATPTRSFD